MRKLILRTMRRSILLLLVLIDVMVNRLFNGRVETISSRAGRAMASGKKWGCILCRILDDIQKDHCANAMLDPLGSLD